MNTPEQPFGPTTSPSRKRSAVLIAENLSKRFNREWIFKNVNITATPGSVTAITGPNGSGKSTLVQVLCGHIPATSGTLRYMDQAASIAEDEVFSKIAIAAPYMDLIEEFTLTELLTFHFKLRSIRNNLSIQDLIELMYLQKSADKQIGNFSSGMKQRLKLGLAFYTSAAVVFLDEPGTNLDETAFQWYLAELKRLPADCCVFIASNNPEEYPMASTALDISAYKK